MTFINTKRSAAREIPIEGSDHSAPPEPIFPTQVIDGVVAQEIAELRKEIRRLRTSVPTVWTITWGVALGLFLHGILWIVIVMSLYLAGVFTALLAANRANNASPPPPWYSTPSEQPPRLQNTPDAPYAPGDKYRQDPKVLGDPKSVPERTRPDQ